MTRGPRAPRVARLLCAVAFAAVLLSSVPATAQPQGTCTPGPETLCLLNDRFQVEVDWQDFSGNPLMIPGVATAGTAGAVHIPVANPRIDSGYMYFYASEHSDLIVKVLDATQINGFIWFAAAAYTHSQFTVHVIDTIEDREAFYENPPRGQTVIFDTTAFPGLPNPQLGALTERGTAGAIAPGGLPGAGGARPEGLPPRAVRLPSHALPSCQEPQIACLHDGRIAVQVEKEVPPGAPPGVGPESFPILNTGISALFEHFEGNGVDVGVKVLDGRAVNDHFWVFYGGLSDIAQQVTITDLVTHEQVTYVSEPGVPFVGATRDPFAPDPPSNDWMETPEIPGFRFQVRVTGGDTVIPTRREADCVPETLCVSAALPGRSELFLRIPGPKPNGFLQPNLVKFSTSAIEVWIEQTATGQLNYYALDAPGPASSDLTGFFDRRGFGPVD